MDMDDDDPYMQATSLSSACAGAVEHARVRKQQMDSRKL